MNPLPAPPFEAFPLAQAAEATAESLLDATNLHLREVNESLLLAVLRVQDLCSQAQQAHQQQTAFLEVLAHELRAPLSPIRNAAALLGRPGSAETLSFAKAVIERQVDHATRLIEDLLDSTRLRTGKLRLDLGTIDLRDVVAAAAQTCKPAIEGREQALAVVLPATPLFVHGDAMRLTQVMNNLLGNASKYTPRGGRIEVSVRSHATTVTVAVADTGIGITQAALQHVFEPYVQEPHAVGHDPSGLGLGLTVARDLVLAHGGTIHAASNGLGRGSCFDLALPLVARPDAPGPATQPATR